MSPTAFLFSGQGAQHVGMGREIAEVSPAARAVYDRAAEALGFDIARVCFEGPAETLDRTDTAQPALLVTSLACLAALEERGSLSPADAAAGLSLGEYTALAYAGALALEDAARLVRLRGELMQTDCDCTPSTMASLLGVEREAAEGFCRTAAGHGIVCVANLNSPGQVVISGAVDAVTEASRLAREAGVRRVIPLQVAGAFHSPLMEAAARGLRDGLADVPIRAPRIPVIANATARPVTTPAEIRDALGIQITSPVLWADSMTYLRDQGYDRFREFGPGRVLAGLLRKIDRSLEVQSFGEAKDLETG